MSGFSLPVNPVELSADGTSLVSGDGVFHVNPPREVEANIDIFDFYQASDRRALTIPNPYSVVGPDLVHPSVVYIPTGFCGWKYWMAYTPYPTENSDYENPCIAVSQDGEIWETPAGVTNPLVAKPAGGYNADTELVYNKSDRKLYLFYRERIAPTSNKLMVMESSNGSTWTSPVAVLTGVYAVTDYASPSVWFDSTDSKWTVIYHNIDGGATYPMFRIRSTTNNVYGAWGTASAITIANPTGGRTWWHSQFKLLPNGRVVGLVQDIVNGGSGAAGALFAAESLDGGITFAVRSVYADLGFYRTAFNIAEMDGLYGLNVWVGRQDTLDFNIRREDWMPDAVKRKFETNAEFVSLYGGYPSNYLYWDNFNRADGAIGAALVGTTPAVDTGTFTIVSNALQTGSAGNNRALTTLTVADYVVEVVLKTATATAAWLWFRTLNTANFYRCGVGAGLGNTLYLEKYVGGAQQYLVQVTGPVYQHIVNPGDRLRVVCRGRRFRIYVNDVFWSEFEDQSFYATGVKFGVQGTNAGVVFDNLLATT